MYLDFFGLKERPFFLTPDPQYLYLSEGHRNALESLLYGIRHREGFMILTGDIGTGKTTICRTLLGRLDKNVKSAVILNSFLTEDELLEAILLEFGFASKGKTRKERIDGLNRLLIHFLVRGQTAVLIVDEAQNLSIPVLEQIRMLTNLETEKEKLLQVILVGQLELEKKLLSSELRQLNQRIAIRLRLLPLSPLETERYIYQRLRVAGGQGQIVFSPSALREIHRFSGGTPRLINLLCERILLAGFVAQTHRFEKSLVKTAERSLRGEDGIRRATPLSKRLSPLRAVSFGIGSLLLGLMVFWSEPRVRAWNETRAFLSRGYHLVEKWRAGRPVAPSSPALSKEAVPPNEVEQGPGEPKKNVPREKAP